VLRSPAKPGPGEELFQWVRSWAAAPQRADRDFPDIADATLRQEVRISCGGSRVRIRFTNEFGGTGVTIGAARVGIAGPGGTVLPGSDRSLTFAGNPVTFVPAGAPAISDPADLAVPALATMVVRHYLPGGVKPAFRPLPNPWTAGRCCRASKRWSLSRPWASSRSAVPSPTAPAR
jgi:hypothetical protein